MSTYTQGPWHYAVGPAPHYQGQIYCEQSGKTLAVTYDDETGSHARVMAAAPELVDALRELKSASEHARANHYDSEFGLRAAEDKARAILAKIDQQL